jgi:hypothetical protein
MLKVELESDGRFHSADGGASTDSRILFQQKKSETLFGPTCSGLKDT